MFSYYGRKVKMAKVGIYPPPDGDFVIEPFAGSAGYSTIFLPKRCLLIDADENIVELWRRMIRMTDRDARLLRPPSEGAATTDLLWIVQSASKRWWQYKSITMTKFMSVNAEIFIRRLRNVLPIIRGWEVRVGDYREAPDCRATWFIDPPYEGDAGTGYAHGSTSIVYPELARWCKKRKGLTIVCESASAKWLPFKPCTENIGIAGKRNSEAVWVRRHEQDADPTDR